MGWITMAVHTGPISLETEFLVVNVPSLYTAILGRRWLHKLKAVPSSLHQKLRFPTNLNVIVSWGDYFLFNNLYLVNYIDEDYILAW
jgi:hypothetical protein